jgi:hypothetical protein
MRRKVLFCAMTGVVLAGLLSAVPVSKASTNTSSATEPYCESHLGVCPDVRGYNEYEGNYVGHDEPAMLFYSNRAGSGNSNTWRLRLPREAPVRPTPDASGGTWNFQRSVTFWVGMALCDTQGYPNPGKPCARDSDANIKDSSDPTSPNWVGNHVGTAFLELQFYPPGWAPFIVGTSCDPTKWCTAMTVTGVSLSLDQRNNKRCLDQVGVQWQNFAFLTTTGVPHAPPDPLHVNASTFTSDPSTDLLMNAGDELAISVHDTAAGLVTAVRDVTTGRRGSMVASAANGFAHPLFQPDASTCTERPYSFHPMYSTSTPHTRVPWAVHTYNVAFSDEIGHFEYCNHVTGAATCTDPGGADMKKDADDTSCVDARISLLVPISGCLASDTDFDGPAYQPDWPGSFSDAVQDRRLHSPSFVVTSPLTGGANYERFAFETDLPAIEFAVGCDVTTGSGCVNPPPGAAVYPLYSTTGTNNCAWREGGTHMPGTTNTFGGSSRYEYGGLQATYYPQAPGFPAEFDYENFSRVLPTNPCPSTGALPG